MRSLPLLCHRNKHRWINRGITHDGHYRLKCPCGAEWLHKPSDVDATATARLRPSER